MQQKINLYFRYNKLSRHIRELARKIKEVDVKDPFRTEATAQLLSSTPDNERDSNSQF
jgi:U3 small nucleolar ribonucleoprotein protein IMP3